MKKFLYWEYEIIFCDSDEQEEIRQGVVPAESMNNALNNIQRHYGKIKQVKNLRQIPNVFSDVAIFDFHDMASDFYITPKDEVK